MTFENIVAKGEIFQVFVTMFSKLSAADLLYVEKGQTYRLILIHLQQTTFEKIATKD